MVKRYVSLAGVTRCDDDEDFERDCIDHEETIFVKHSDHLQAIKDKDDLLRDARKIIRASSSRNLAKDWDRRATKELSE